MLGACDAARTGEGGHLPQHFALGHLKGVEGAGPGHHGHLFGAQTGAGGQIGKAGEGPPGLPLINHPPRGIVPKVAHHAQAKAHRAVFHRAAHLRPVDAGAKGAHAAPAGVAHQAGGWIEAHGLGIDEGGQELGGVVAPEPCALVRQHGECG